MFSWIYIDDFEIQFIDLKDDLENIEKERLETGVTMRNGKKRSIKDLEYYSISSTWYTISFVSDAGAGLTDMIYKMSEQVFFL